MRKNPTIGWISIGIALLSAVGIFFIKDYRLWFLVVLLVNLLIPVLFNKRYNKSALTLCRLLVGALFIFSSFTKGVDPLGTKYKILDYLAAYHMTWLNEAAMVLAMMLILAEFVVGICLFTNVLPRIAVLGASLLMLFFTVTTLFDACYNLVPDCGCFGAAVKMSNWQTFYKNLVIDAVLLPLIFNNRQLKNRLSSRVQLVIGCIYAIAFLGFEIYNYRHLPIVDFMNWKVGKKLSVESDTPDQIYLTYRNKQTGETQDFVSTDYPWNDSVWMSQWEFVDQKTKGGAHYLGFSAMDMDGNDVTEMILGTADLFMFTSHDLTKVTEGEWEKARRITEAADRHGYNVIWVVANEPEYVERLQSEYDFIYEVYYADELEIKTVVRFNPGLVLLDEGLVVDKWSAIDFPQGVKLDQLFER